MTLDLDELERLIAEATPGPWAAGRPDMTSYDVGTGQPFKNVYGSDNDTRAERHHVTGDMLAPVIARAEGDTCHEDAQLITAAVNALPDLLSAARQRDRLRALCLRLHRYVDRLGTDEGTVGAVDEWEGIEGELRGEGVLP